MKRIVLGLLLIVAPALLVAQQQTPDCQDTVTAKGYPPDSPSFGTRTLVSHARDKDTSRINRTPVKLPLKELGTHSYKGALIPEFENDGNRQEGDEMQVWEVTGILKSAGSTSVNRYGIGSQDYTVCDAGLVNCVFVSLSPPECVGDSAFSPEMLAAWQKHLTGQIATGSTYTVRGPAYFCCENGVLFNIKPVIDIFPAEPGSGDGDGDGGGGTITPPDVQVLLPPAIGEQPVVLGNGQSSSFDVTTTAVSSFNGDVQLAVWTDALESDNFSVTVTPSFIPAPGRGEAEIKIDTSATTFPRDYHVTIAAIANDKQYNTSFIVSVTCDPPIILGIDQPKDVTVNAGVKAVFEVHTLGTGPYQYQWYKGRRGSTLFPVSNSNSEKLEVLSTDDMNLYWVRVSNACGTVDSNTVSVAPARLRAVRH